MQNYHFFCPTLSRLLNVCVFRHSGCNLFECLFINVVKMHKNPIGELVFDCGEKHKFIFGRGTLVARTHETFTCCSPGGS